MYFPWRDIENIKQEGYRTREANILKALDSDNHKIIVMNRINNFKLINKLLKKENIAQTSNLTVNEVNNRGISSIKTYIELPSVKSIEFPTFINPRGNILEDFKLVRKVLLSYLVKEIEHTFVKSISEKIYLWASDVSRVELCQELKEILNKKGYEVFIIFDMIDDLTEHSQYSIKQKQRYSRKYVRWDFVADMCFSVSARNLLKFRNIKHKKHYSNGIDLMRFSQKNISGDNESKYILGYIGLIENRIDLEIIKSISDEIYNQSLNAEIRLIGPVINNDVYSILKKIPSVTLAGSISYNEVPKEINKFDVALLPHRVNKFTLSMSPLKVYEYLASNKKIIMTNVPPAEEIKSLPGVSVCFSNEEFTNKAIELISAGNNDDIYYMNDYKKYLDKNSWESITRSMCKTISDYS